jgi:hypothetical protein
MFRQAACFDKLNMTEGSFRQAPCFDKLNITEQSMFRQAQHDRTVHVSTNSMFRQAPCFDKPMFRQAHVSTSST